MCLQELSTCKQYRLPIKIINLNNKYMGMVRQWQQFFHGNRYSESYMDALPDFVKLAEGYGHRGVLIEKPADVEPALRDAFARKNELVFLDFITDQTENVYPMIPGGKGITEMILSEELSDAATSSPSSWKTRPARCRASPGCSPRAATTSSRSPWRRPRTPRCRA